MHVFRHTGTWVYATTHILGMTTDARLRAFKILFFVERWCDMKSLLTGRWGMCVVAAVRGMRGVIISDKRAVGLR